jgi:hypothetical protein
MKIYSKTKRFDLDLTYYLKNQLVKSRIHFLFKDNMLSSEKSLFQERFELTNSFFGLKKMLYLVEKVRLKSCLS